MINNICFIFFRNHMLKVIILNNNKKMILLVIFVFCISLVCISSVSAARFEDYYVNYHKHTYNHGEACSMYPKGKCPNAWKTTIQASVGGTSGELSKYSYGRVKINGKIVSQKWKQSSMKGLGREFYGTKKGTTYFMIDTRISGTKSLNGKTLKFEGYDKTKRKWVTISYKKIKKSSYSRGYGYY